MNSKYFCQQLQHTACHHDWDKETQSILEIISGLTTVSPPKMMNVSGKVESKDAKDVIIAQLQGALEATQATSESYWQKHVHNALLGTSLKREIISSHRFVTDLSNDNFLIEIKHQKDFRTAFGQVQDYIYYKRKAGQQVYFTFILLFGLPPMQANSSSATLWADRRAFCEEKGILLRWLQVP